MERRYNIVDADDMNMAKTLMGERMKASETVVESVVVSGKAAKPGDTGAQQPRLLRKQTRPRLLTTELCDPRRVGRRQPSGDLPSAIQSPAQVGLYPAQLFSVHQFRDPVKDAILAAEVVDGDDVGMVQSSHSAGFPLEALAADWIVGHLGQNLQGDFALEPRILRPIDLTHPPVPSGARIS